MAGAVGLNRSGAMASRDQDVQRRRAGARLAVLAVGVMLVGIAGYVGFVVFTGSERGTGTGTLLLAAGTGFAAFFSPCAFPLMLTFLSRQAAGSPRSALASAAMVAAGAVTLFGLVAVLIGAGAGAIGGVLAFESGPGRVFRFAVGALLVVFGLRQARLVRIRMRWLDRVASTSARLFDPSRVTGGRSRDFVYGFGYLLAGFG